MTATGRVSEGRTVTLPALGLLVSVDPPPQLPALLRCLLRWCAPRYAQPGADEVDAWLASSLSAPGVEEAARGTRPLAVWVADSAEAEATMALPGRIAAVVTTDDTVVADHPDAVVFPVAGVDASGIDPVLPFVRTRWRARSGLPSPMIVDLVDPAAALAADLLPTALALASSVIVAGPDLIEAMAWGAPCVTDSASAAAAGARPGVDCLVAAPGEATELAARLADDPLLASELARAGRRLVEARHDNYRPALRLARKLGLVDTVSPAGRVDAVLDDLGTPTSAFVRRRMALALVDA